MIIVSKWENNFIWSLNRILTVHASLGQNEPGSNGNKEVLNITQSSWNGVSPSNTVYFLTHGTRWGIS